MNFKNMLIGFFCSISVVGCAGGMGDGCCGWRSRENNGVGQVKKVRLDTPILCPDYHSVDISFGIMRNGVGSMSTHDMSLYVPENLVPELKKAADEGAIVNFTYDTRRAANCVEHDRLTSFKRAE